MIMPQDNITLTVHERRIFFKAESGYDIKRYKESVNDVCTQFACSKRPDQPVRLLVEEPPSAFIHPEVHGFPRIGSSKNV